MFISNNYLIFASKKNKIMNNKFTGKICINGKSSDFELSASTLNDLIHIIKSMHDTDGDNDEIEELTLTECEHIDNFSSNEIDAESMLENFKMLKTLIFNLHNSFFIKNMNDIFSCCSSLKVLDLRSFHTSHVTDIPYAFNCCKTLASLDLSSFDFSKVINTEYMFNGCESLTDLKFGKNLKASIDLSDSPLLSHDSVLTIIGGLLKVKNADLCTIILSNETYNTLSKEEIDKVEDKNWSIYPISLIESFNKK